MLNFTAKEATGVEATLLVTETQ
jgi:hypothetical protein